MALVQMRTPSGSYSMVDAELVEDYGEVEGKSFWDYLNSVSEI